MTFDCYSLNDEEIAAARKMMEDDEVAKSLEFSGEVAGDALADLKEDLDYFLKSADEKAKEEAEKDDDKKKGDDINPFAALFGGMRKKKKDKKKDEEKVVLEADKIAKDNYVEGMMREEAVSGAAGGLYTIYDIYKKAHRMASSSTDFDADV